ncbi:glycoside hydrolase family 55 protein [Falsiroseomonas tokyonensis]|uniref:Glycoside hydrolase family 55 protein n=1 Tax=Falsiroseomonas tokyonensis TaxID=430521 RepID=A0ABV7C237_9PROT|nr:glycoside hydrolase family 55 protein [Falsiroseomonas tokyonensis]MBU8540181.1 hypothetical protein [Falsiroseomonas tokyonensis]
MASPRYSIPDFAIENTFYAGATVSIFTLDEDLNRTETLAAVYANPVGATLLANPVALDSRGRWPQPVYVGEPVIMVIERDDEVSETGVVSQANRWRGIWQAGTLYFPGERLRDPVFPRTMVVNAGHTSSTFMTDLAAGLLSEEMNLAQETVVMYGAKGDGSTNDSAAILAMQAAVGYITFPSGTFRISTALTVTVPMYFMPGAQLLIDSGILVMLRGRHVFADRVPIFTGSGTVKFQGNDDDASGATIYPEWWGRFPRSGNCAGIIQKMSDACSLLTEWHATFLGGVYRLDNGVTFGRGAFIEGLGQTRRTVFVVNFASGDVMHFTDTAARIEGIQFEQTMDRTSGANVRFDGADSILRDVNTGGWVGVAVNANGCLIEGLVRIGSGTTSGPLLTNTGQGTTIINMRAALNAAAMVAVQLLAGSAFVEIDGLVTTGSAAYAVDVQATGFIPSCVFRRIRCRNNTRAGVNIECSGSGSFQNFIIDGVQMGPGTVTGSASVRLVNNSSSNLFGGTISNINPRGGEHGIYAERNTTGALNQIVVSNSILTGAATAVTETGTEAAGISITLDSETVLT